MILNLFLFAFVDTDQDKRVEVRTLDGILLLMNCLVLKQDSSRNLKGIVSEFLIMENKNSLGQKLMIQTKITEE